jgi:hypothetical protein
VFQIRFPTTKSLSRFFLICYLFFLHGNLFRGYLKFRKPPTSGVHLSASLRPAPGCLLGFISHVAPFWCGYKREANRAVQTPPSSSLVLGKRTVATVAHLHRSPPLMPFPLPVQVLLHHRRFLVGRRVGAVACKHEDTAA